MRIKAAVVGLALLATGALISGIGISVAAGTSQSTLVSAAPAVATPNIDDGTVYAIAQVGTRIIVGGSFTSVNPPGDTNTAHAVARKYVLAFDAATGAVDAKFIPKINGVVQALKPGPTPDTVYIGGEFTTLNGATARGVVLVSTVTGLMVTGFKPAVVNGIVYTLGRSGNHLILGGTFTTVGGATHDGIGSINATTGAAETYINVQLTGHHNYNDTTGANGAVGPRMLDISPDGTKAVVIGNFKKANNVLHDQIVQLNLASTAGTINTAWNTSGYTSACASGAFDTYMRDVSFAPDGSYFVIAATGAGTTTKNTDGTRALCDAVARWDAGVTSTNARPVWVNYTGNDSLLSVATTGTAVYVGGHERWLDNSGGSDKPGPGAVPRPGVAALDPASGIPFAWNPGRNPRGSGAWALLATANGVYVGSDTDKIGSGATYTTRGRIAFFPVAGGASVPRYAPATLPASIFLAGSLPSGANDLRSRSFTGTTAGAVTARPAGPVDWSQVRGAFTAGGTLFFGYSDGKLYRADFDGTTVGPPALVDPYNDPIWSTVDTGSGQTYRGTVPTMYGAEMQSVTGMVFAGGRIYFSLAGQAGLRFRAFGTDDGALGDETTVTSTMSFANVNGMFLAGNTLYYADKTSGNLQAVAWNNGAPSGAVTVVSGPAKDGNDWRARALFTLPTPAPTAAFTPSCTVLACAFDASASTAPDSVVAGYQWDFGDGTTGSGATPTHDYATAGQYAVTLTVTNSFGGSAVASHVIQPYVPAPALISFVGSADANANAATVTVTVPAAVQADDGMLLYVAAANQAVITGPAGWTLAGTSPASSTGITTAVYYRVATDTDAGTPVDVGFAAATHSTVQLLAYRGTNTTDPVVSATVGVAGSGSMIAAPTVSGSTNTTWIVTAFSAKSSTVTGWTVNGAQTARDIDNGTGSGRINSVVVDSATNVPPGAAGGIVGTADQAYGSANSWTIVIS